jgi:hypothetical protein
MRATKLAIVLLSACSMRRAGPAAARTDAWGGSRGAP